MPWHAGSLDTLVDARGVIAAAIEELGYVASGLTLANPIVSMRVLELAEHPPAVSEDA